MCENDEDYNAIWILVRRYRPISLLNTLTKLTERTILTRKKDEIEEHNLVPDTQNGFR